MRVATRLLLILALGLPWVAQADAPRTSPRPQHREPAAQAAKKGIVQVFYRADIRPRARGDFSTKSPSFQDVETENGISHDEHEAAYMLATTAPVYRSPRPNQRPADLNVQKPTRKSPGTRVASLNPTAISTPGSVCGDPRIKGVTLAPIAGKLPGCGQADPVRITSIDGIRLSQASIMDCKTATSLRNWVTKSVRPTFGRRAGGLTGLKVAAHYSCRTRNNKAGAKISEHGKGHAIDISGFIMADGSTITVEQGWQNRQDKRLLAAVHAKACGPFGTVLGPDADRFHQDHFHLDTARYRSGSYCR
jgi:hypothetical protein